MFRTILQAFAGLAIAALPIAAAAQSAGDTLLPSQTVITGALEQPISSKNAQIGDPFVLDVQSPYPGDDQRFNGAKIYGHVASVGRAAGSHKGSLNLAFDRLALADGTTASLQGTLLSLDQKQGGSTAARGLMGAIVGNIVGNYLGKHIGTDIGGAVGAIGGGLYAASLGTNVTVNQGSTIEMKTTQPSTILSRRQAGYPGQNYPGQNYPNQNYPNQPPPPPNPQNQGPVPTPYPTPYH
ncbi:MAG TPA: hypothetical protein VMA36_05425 [Candidatus Limnocylindria bacterium]|jgi:hypothetical protein|nr:hypothetical protein [Candidatus Limnocylindria bacterium]